MLKKSFLFLALVTLLALWLTCPVFAANVSADGNGLLVILLPEGENTPSSFFYLSPNSSEGSLTLTQLPVDRKLELPDYKNHHGGIGSLATGYALGNSWGDTEGAIELTVAAVEKSFGIVPAHTLVVPAGAVDDILDKIFVELHQLSPEPLEALCRTLVGIQLLDNSAQEDLAALLAAKCQHDADENTISTALAELMQEASKYKIASSSLS